MLAYLFVGLGGAIGSIARYAISVGTAALWGDAFPWGTILINVTGSFLIAYFGTMTLPDGVLPASPGLRLFVMVGICGGFTTFSSFSLQTLVLMRSGAWVGAAANIFLSVALCIAGVTIGHVAALKSAALFHREAASGSVIVARSDDERRSTVASLDD